MKRLLTLILACILISISSSSMAKPAAEEFRNKEYDYSSIKSVLALPVMYEITIPPNEPFLDDSVQQRWRELTSQEKGGFSFLVKTPEQIIERDDFVKGTGPSEKPAGTRPLRRRSHSPRNTQTQYCRQPSRNAHTRPSTTLRRSSGIQGTKTAPYM